MDLNATIVLQLALFLTGMVLVARLLLAPFQRALDRRVLLTEQAQAEGARATAEAAEIEAQVARALQHQADLLYRQREERLRALRQEAISVVQRAQQEASALLQAERTRLRQELPTLADQALAQVGVVVQALATSATRRVQE